MHRIWPLPIGGGKQARAKINSRVASLVLTIRAPRAEKKIDKALMIAAVCRRMSRAARPARRRASIAPRRRIVNAGPAAGEPCIDASAEEGEEYIERGGRNNKLRGCSASRHRRAVVMRCSTSIPRTHRADAGAAPVHVASSVPQLPAVPVAKRYAPRHVVDWRRRSCRGVIAYILQGGDEIWDRTLRRTTGTSLRIALILLILEGMRASGW